MKECKSCGKELYGQQKTFCSRACRNKFHVRHDMLVARREKVCKVCGKAFLAYRANKLYCSSHCLGKAAYALKKGRMPERIHVQGKQWQEQRNKALIRQNGLCWLCKGILGKFELHHTVYGDHRVDSEHLVALCKTCHKQIHGVTVCLENGIMTFHGKALDYLKAKEA